MNKCPECGKYHYKRRKLHVLEYLFLPLDSVINRPYEIDYKTFAKCGKIQRQLAALRRIKCN